MSFAVDWVYWVQSNEDDSVMLAIDARITGGAGDEFVEWFDTVRDRAFAVVDVSTADDVVTVRTPAATYRFDPLTLERYRADVGPKVIGSQRFFSTEEVQRFYVAFPR